MYSLLHRFFESFFSSGMNHVCLQEGKSEFIESMWYFPRLKQRWKMKSFQKFLFAKNRQIKTWHQHTLQYHADFTNAIGHVTLIYQNCLRNLIFEHDWTLTIIEITAQWEAVMTYQTKWSLLVPHTYQNWCTLETFCLVSGDETVKNPLQRSNMPHLFNQLHPFLHFHTLGGKLMQSSKHEFIFMTTLCTRLCFTSPIFMLHSKKSICLMTVEKFSLAKHHEVQNWWNKRSSDFYYHKLLKVF